MGQITEAFARTMLANCEDGKHAPLTVWEEKQLVLAWLERERLREAIGTVCDGFTLHPEARKILEAALWA